MSYPPSLGDIPSTTSVIQTTGLSAIKRIETCLTKSESSFQKFEECRAAKESILFWFLTSSQFAQFVAADCRKAGLDSNACDRKILAMIEPSIEKDVQDIVKALDE